MPVAFAALDKGTAVLGIAFRAVELAALAVAGRAVALQVADMRAGGASAELVADDPRLDDDPAMALADAPLALQPIDGGLAAPDPRAPSLLGRPAAAHAGNKPERRKRTAIRLRRRLHDLAAFMT
jgi:hypothetical protein